jgi:hypothetical protein
MNEREVRAKALEIAVALIAALPEKEKIAFLDRTAELTAEQVVVTAAGFFAKYIKG